MIPHQGKELFLVFDFEFLIANQAGV